MSGRELDADTWALAKLMVERVGDTVPLPLLQNLDAAR